MDMKKYVYALDIFDLLGSDVEGVTPLSRGLFSPKKGAEEPEVKRDPAREMAQLTVATFGGEDNARKFLGSTPTATSNDYSDLSPWRDAALRSAEEAELLKMENSITQSLGAEDVVMRNLTGNPFEGNQLTGYKAPPLPEAPRIVSYEGKESTRSDDTPPSATITDPTTGVGLMSPPTNGGNSFGSEPSGAGYAPGIKPPEESYNIVSKQIGIDPELWDIYRTEIAAIESGTTGNYTAKGGSNNHYDGRYQMGRMAKADAAQLLGIDLRHDAASREAFRADPQKQEEAFAAYTARNHRYMMTNPAYKAMSTPERMAVLGYAHNQGHGGAKEWISTGKIGRDGFDTPADIYPKAINFALANYDSGEDDV